VLHNLSVCICSLRYPSCNAHAPYCHLWSAQLYCIFTHFFIKGTILLKNSYWTQNYDLIFSTTFVWNISHSKKKWVRYDKSAYWSSCKVSFILVRFWRNLNLINRFSEKNPSYIKFHENPSSGSRVVPPGRTNERKDKRTDMTKLIVAFRNFAKAPKK